jgi:ATPase subunit of ABC transporter with duplicated ATPase domains
MIMFLFLSGACLFISLLFRVVKNILHIEDAVTSTGCRKHGGSHQLLPLDPSPLVPRPLWWIPSWRLGPFLRGQKERKRAPRGQKEGQKGKRCQKEQQNLKESSKKRSLTRSVVPRGQNLRQKGAKRSKRRTKRCKKVQKDQKNGKKGSLTRVGFEPTHISVVEIGKAGLKSTALDHSAIVSDGEIDQILNLGGI